MTLHCAGCAPDAPTYANTEELEIHIASDHINYVPYECEKCRFSRFPTEFALHSHYRNDHGLKEFYVKYKVTPESGRKRQLVKELLQKSLNISDCNANAKSSKRKRTSAVEVVQSATSAVLSPCSSPDPEGTPRTCESDRTIKPELVKVDCSSEKSCGTTEKDLGQHVVVAATGEITLSNNYQTYGNGAYSEVVPHESGGSLCRFDVAMKHFDTQMTADLPQGSFFATETSTQPSTSSQNAASGGISKRRRPPRTCTECGLQVTGQRSSLVYHANSKHLRLPLFYCQPCNKTWTTITKSDVLKHVKAVHRGDESKVIDYRAQYGDKIREMTDKCFPPKQRGGVNDEEDVECSNADGGFTSMDPDEAPAASEHLHWLGNEESHANTV